VVKEVRVEVPIEVIKYIEVEKIVEKLVTEVQIQEVIKTVEVPVHSTQL
jgi:hypothetical protein